MSKFDIHVVAHEFGPETEGRLVALGFAAEVVAGGDDRVRMRTLLSKKCNTAAMADSWFSEAVTVLDQDSLFRGYIEEEETETRIAIDSDEKNKTIDAFQRIDSTPGRGQRLKTCDVHASAVWISAGLRKALIDAGLYFLQLEKAAGVVTVFTIQTESISTGRWLGDQLVKYLQDQGGFRGSVKFEQLRSLKNYGATLPPIVLAG